MRLNQFIFHMIRLNTSFFNVIFFNFRDPDLLTVPHWQSPTREQHRVSWAQTSRHSSIPCDNSATKGIDLFRHRSSSFASLSIMNGYKLLRFFRFSKIISIIFLDHVIIHNFFCKYQEYKLSSIFIKKSHCWEIKCRKNKWWKSWDDHFRWHFHCCLLSCDIAHHVWNIYGCWVVAHCHILQTKVVWWRSSRFLYSPGMYNIVYGIIQWNGNLIPEWNPRNISILLQEWSSQTKVIGPVIILIGFVMLVCGISICALSWKLANEDRGNSMFGTRRGVGENNNTFQYYYGGNDRCTSQVLDLNWNWY